MNNTDFDVKNYFLSFGVHNSKKVIFFKFKFKFKYNTKLINDLRKTLTVKWSNTNKCWYALDMPQYRTLLNLHLPPIGDSLLSKIHPTNHIAFKSMQKLLVIKGYSHNTQRVYLTEFALFLEMIKHHDADLFDATKLNSYMYYCAHNLKLKENTLHARLNALKFYYDQVLGRESYKYDVLRPKKQSILPKVISKQDIKKMLNTIENQKHRIALQLVYGMGLRVSEIVGLKISDIDSRRMMVHIQNAKGKKDRYVPLPNSILEDLRDYVRNYKPSIYLLEGQTGGQYTIRSVQSIFKTAMTKAKINKTVGIHGLRHSYATHLLEAGTDMTFIQKLLGHRDIKTTMIYANIAEKELAKVQSPLDKLNQD